MQSKKIQQQIPTQAKNGEHKNLIQINTTKKNNSNNIRIATMNTRSVKNKQLQIVEIVQLQNLDFIMLTETWLKNTMKTKHG